MKVKLPHKMFYERALHKPHPFGVELPEEALEHLPDGAEILGDEKLQKKFDKIKEERRAQRKPRNANDQLNLKARVEKLEKGGDAAKDLEELRGLIKDLTLELAETQARIEALEEAAAPKPDEGKKAASI